MYIEVTMGGFPFNDVSCIFAMYWLGCLFNFAANVSMEKQIITFCWTDWYHPKVDDQYRLMTWDVQIYNVT